MSRSTHTIYECDGCLTEMPVKDLRRFRLAEFTIDEGREVAAAQTDLCADCEKRLHEALGLFPDSEAEKMHGIVRG